MVLKEPCRMVIPVMKEPCLMMVREPCHTVIPVASSTTEESYQGEGSPAHNRGGGEGG